MTREEVLERYFLDMRARTLDLAAALDRLDRARAGGADEDGRMQKLARALAVLSEDESGPDRAERIQRIFSREYDPNWRENA